MNLRALYRPINLGYPLKISLSLDEFYILKAFSIEDKGHLFPETIGIGCIILRFHSVQIDKMVVFDSLGSHQFGF